LGPERRRQLPIYEAFNGKEMRLSQIRLLGEHREFGAQQAKFSPYRRCHASNELSAGWWRLSNKLMPAAGKRCIVTVARRSSIPIKSDNSLASSSGIAQGPRYCD
jgi:hypothetical protein